MHRALLNQFYCQAATLMALSTLLCRALAQCTEVHLRESCGMCACDMCMCYQSCTQGSEVLRGL